MDEQQLKKYWEDIPVGKANAISYGDLCELWNRDKRSVRHVLNALSLATFDNQYILIRSSHGKGFYKTDDINEINAFRLECLSRGRACLAPVSQINKVLNIKYSGDFDLFTALEQIEHEPIPNM